MKSLWNEKEAARCQDDLALRVYTSRLIGGDPALVLHGGGNTSVKAQAVNLFGEKEEILYVKGSGWDLATIEAPGFAPVRLGTLKRMAELETLSDSDMVKNQRAAMIDPSAPSPSVEAILHAIIPFRFVDHTHADAVVTLTNTRDGLARAQKAFGKRVLVLPYLMPGFVLARQIRQETRDVNWPSLEGIVLLNHGIFTFADDARTSYERMVELVTRAEEALAAQGAFSPRPQELSPSGPQTPMRGEDLLALARMRKAVSTCAKVPQLARINRSEKTIEYTLRPDLRDFCFKGTLTPDHVISTKPQPMLAEENPAGCVEAYAAEYQAYFERNADGGQVMLDPAPRWAVWPGKGTVAFGPNGGRLRVIEDINRHTVCGSQWSQKLGGWEPLSEKDLFALEYWELEQAKLKRSAGAPEFEGKVALVTGAASGIGRMCAQELRNRGASVCALDINPEIRSIFKGDGFFPLVCDVTSVDALNEAVARTVETFGGLDILVTNAGAFPSGREIDQIGSEDWKKGIEINLSSHQYLMKAAIPFLREGIDPAIIVIASKNVPAPGPGAGLYSAAKAGLTQLARVAALELGPKGVRVNVVHPNAVFDTAIWTDSVLKDRAEKYGLTVDEYKRNNVMKTEVTSKDVARMVCAMAGPVFGRTTGAQVPVDGGNDRVI
ncbi:MAG: bifunctional aldolase/short-chain dehydrogenase [Bdellovibrionales bacterium]|nr:bifunctional aldolase/short-chain dehydrogenase [Bdellovibrionales bacterium]